MSLSDCSSQGGLQRFQSAEILVKGKEGKSLPRILLQVVSPAKWVWAFVSTGPRDLSLLHRCIHRVRVCARRVCVCVCVCVCGCIRACCGMQALSGSFTVAPGLL